MTIPTFDQLRLRSRSRSRTDSLKMKSRNEQDACCSSLRTEKRRSKQQHTVSFFPNVRVRRISHFKDYTPEELKACWFTDDEIKNLRANAKIENIEDEARGSDHERDFEKDQDSESDPRDESD